MTDNMLASELQITGDLRRLYSRMAAEAEKKRPLMSIKVYMLDFYKGAGAFYMNKFVHKTCLKAAMTGEPMCLRKQKPPTIMMVWDDHGNGSNPGKGKPKQPHAPQHAIREHVIQDYSLMSVLEKHVSFGRQDEREATEHELTSNQLSRYMVVIGKHVSGGLSTNECLQDFQAMDDKETTRLAEGIKLLCPGLA
jgi:hypothetical protein